MLAAYKAQNKKKWFIIGLLFFCVLFSFILYAPVLKSYFIAEDFRHLTFDWGEVWDEFFAMGQSVGFRPGSTLYLVINNKLWERNPIGHHGTVIFLHALTGWLVGLVMLRVTKKFIVAGIAALLFIGSPTQVEAVSWIAAAAGTVTSALICMLAIWVWIRSDRTPNYFGISVVALLYLSALLVKELSLPLPGLLMVFDWFLGRRFTAWRLKEIIRSSLFYWPFYAVLGIYIFLYWNSGALAGAVSYGTPAGVSILSMLARLSLSARNMFLPLSGYVVDTGAGAGNLLWLLAFCALIGFSHQRWTFILALVSLIPSLFLTGGRMTYQAMAGFSMGITLLLFDVVRSLSARTSSKWMVPALVGMTGILLFGYAMGVYRESVPVIEGGQANWSIPRQAKEQVTLLPPNAEVYFIGFPDEAVLRWGIIHEMQYVYQDPTLTVYSVEDGQPIGLTDKIPLQTIQCEADAPRFFFQYDAESKVLLLVDEKEFGLICP